MGDPRQNLGSWDVVAGDPLTITTYIGVDGTTATLSAAAAAGATSISLSVSFASGTILFLGSGNDLEAVTTSGAPTGTGPYATTVSALANAHSAGEAAVQFLGTDLATFGTWASDLRQSPSQAPPVVFTVDNASAANGILTLALTGAQTTTLATADGGGTTWHFDLQATGGTVSPQTPFMGSVTAVKPYTHA